MITTPPVSGEPGQVRDHTERNRRRRRHRAVGKLSPVAFEHRLTTAAHAA
jgi:hypothetical protein